MTPTLRYALAGVAAIAMLVACSPKQPERHEVTITLDWNTDGIAIADGRGTFKTDLGYVVEADQLEITAYSFELVPCDPLPPMPPMPQKQSAFSLIGTAWAGHRIGHPPTLTGQSRVERPLRATTLTLDRIKVPDVAYCQGHYLIARMPDPPSDPADTASVGISLRVHGRYRKADSAAWSDFAIQTTVAHGVVVDFKPESRKGLRIENGDTVVVTHRLDGLFNGLDFAAMKDQEQARQILRQVVAGTGLIHEHAEAAGAAG
jgi:hypothetical protein